jgi:acetoin utilization deacetylase AcuC-like enzyme
LRLKSCFAIHKQEYVDDLLNLTLNQKQHEKLIFQELIERELRIAQGTIIGAQNLLKQKSFNIAGGTHHAYSTHGEAFVCK